MTTTTKHPDKYCSLCGKPIYRDQKRNELNGMYELLEALGYSHTAIMDDDGNDVDLIITKAE